MSSQVEIKQLSTAIEAISTLLGQVTGLPELSRKTIAYYTLATYTVESVSTFPLLVLLGPMASGKSQTLLVVKALAYKPQTLSPRTFTGSAIRDKLGECHNGTAIIEEADAGWKESITFEALISDRYQRESAKGAKKVPRGDGGWDTEAIEFFGPTVLHRRVRFVDPALDGRSILVRYRADNTRTYVDFSAVDPAVAKIKELIKESGFKTLPDMPTSRSQPGLAGRILASYGPVIAIAQLCNDLAFIEQIQEPLKSNTSQLREDQSVEPDGLVVRAIVDLMSTGSGTLRFHNIKVKDLRMSILNNYNVPLEPRQIAGLARDLGFTTKNSHGFTVVVPTPMTLVRAAEQVGYEDEAITALKEQLKATEGDRAG